MSLQENKAVVRRLFDEVWNQANIDVLDEIIAENIVNHRIDDTEVLTNPRDQRETFAEIFAGFTNTQVSYDDPIAEGDRVCVRWTATADNAGSDEGMKKLHICIYRIEGGRIAETWTCY